MGKSSINGPFSMAMLNNQRVNHHKSIANHYLVGGIPTPLKNMSSSVGMIIPNIWKQKTCSKPPTRYIYIYIYIYFHFYTYSNFLSCFWTFYTYSVCLYIYVYDRVCSMLPGQKCWQDGIIPFLGRPGTGHRHGLFPLKSLLSSKQVPQRLQYLLMAAWFPIWGCRGIIIICWMIIFQIVIIYQWKTCW